MKITKVLAIGVNEVYRGDLFPQDLEAIKKLLQNSPYVDYIDLITYNVIEE